MKRKFVSFIVLAVVLIVLSQIGVIDNQRWFVITSISAVLSAYAAILATLPSQESSKASITPPWVSRLTMFVGIVFITIFLHQGAIVIAHYLWFPAESFGQFTDKLAALALTFGFLFGGALGAYSTRWFRGQHTKRGI